MIELYYGWETYNSNYYEYENLEYGSSTFNTKEEVISKAIDLAKEFLNVTFGNNEHTDKDILWEFRNIVEENNYMNQFPELENNSTTYGDGLTLWSKLFNLAYNKKDCISLEIGDYDALYVISFTPMDIGEPFDEDEYEDW